MASAEKPTTSRPIRFDCGAAGEFVYPGYRKQPWGELEGRRVRASYIFYRLETAFTSASFEGSWKLPGNSKLTLISCYADYYIEAEDMTVDGSAIIAVKSR